MTNLITVKPRMAPSELKRKIEEALIRHAKTDAVRIPVFQWVYDWRPYCLCDTARCSLDRLHREAERV